MVVIEQQQDLTKVQKGEEEKKKGERCSEGGQ